MATFGRNIVLIQNSEVDAFINGLVFWIKFFNKESISVAWQWFYNCKRFKADLLRLKNLDNMYTLRPYDIMKTSQTIVHSPTNTKMPYFQRFHHSVCYMVTNCSRYFFADLNQFSPNQQGFVQGRHSQGTFISCNAPNAKPGNILITCYRCILKSVLNLENSSPYVT